MMQKYMMALDQGTTSSRCLIFDKAGTIISVAQEEFTQIYPQAGWVEHDPMEIWETQLKVAKEAMAKAEITAEQICGIGITNQRETTVVWDKHTGKPVYNAIVWQCRRTAEYIDTIKSYGYDQIIKEKTGLVADAYFSGSKIKWILDNVEGAREAAENGDLLFGTIDTWLIWNLTGGESFVTEYTNAARTMIFNIHELCWDKELLALMRIPEQMLPEVKPSSCIYGYTKEELFGGKIAISGAAGDQQSALFGQCCFEPGEAKSTYGTGGFLLLNTGKQAIESKNGLLTTIAASSDGEVRYALEGSVYIAGAAIQWLRDEMELVENSAESEKYALSVPDSNGVYLVPAFTGLAAPYWDQYARGVVVGLTRGVKKAHFIRATLEALAYQTYDVLKAMEADSGIALSTLKVDGGACANNFLMQFQANVIDTEVQRPQVIETTGLGAAYLAGLAVGYWKDIDDVKENWKLGRTFTPEMTAEDREKAVAGWHKAVSRACDWA